MVLPVGEPVHVELRSDDVIHAFYVPKFLFKRDVVPGRNNTFDFTVEEPGTYRGQCAELCGAFHGDMLFDVHAVPRADYDVWLAEQIAKANATPPPAPSGEAAGPALQLDRQEHRVRRRRRSRRRPTRRSRSTSTTTTPACRTTSRSRTRTGGVAFQGEIFTGVAETRLRRSRRSPSGTYPFVCTVHPNMTGNLTVK